MPTKIKIEFFYSVFLSRTPFISVHFCGWFDINDDDTKQRKTQVLFKILHFNRKLSFVLVIAEVFLFRFVSFNSIFSEFFYFFISEGFQRHTRKRSQRATNWKKKFSFFIHSFFHRKKMEMMRAMEKDAFFFEWI